MDYEIFRSDKSRLLTTDLRFLGEESQVFGFGALLVCRHGEADLRIDFRTWHLSEGRVLMLFPSDVLQLLRATDDFSTEMLIYDRAMLREASLQLEHTVYEDLRRDRCRGDGDNATVRNIVEGIFSLLRIYFSQEACRVRDQLVLYELKGFFLGYYDYLRQQPMERRRGEGERNVTRRANELFNRFMEALEEDYKQTQRVADYAGKLHISAKYLTLIVRSVNGLTPKAMIDHFVTMQIKLQLRTTNMSIKQMAWDYHFSDASFFVRYFRQRTGMTPQEYRRTFRSS